MDHFLLVPGEWQGSGTVTLSMSPEVLSFKTSWIISSIDENTFQAIQTVDVTGADTMSNVFTLKRRDRLSDAFEILLENETLGTFHGKGVCNQETIAWEFIYPGALEGLEIYQRVSDPSTSRTYYQFRAEYNGGDGYRTLIEGSLYPYGAFASDSSYQDIN